MRRALVGLLLALMSGLFIPLFVGQVPAHACSCAMATLADQAKAADLVFVGTADRDSINEPDAGSVDPITFTATVDQVFAGDVPATLQLQTSNQSAACGLGTVPTGALIWFVYLEDGSRNAKQPLNVGLCSAPAPADAKNLAEVTGALGEARPVQQTAGEKPADPSAATADSRAGEPEKAADSSSDSATWWLLGAGVVVVGALGAVFWRRSQRARA